MMIRVDMLACFAVSILALTSVVNAETASVLHGKQWKKTECQTVKELKGVRPERPKEEAICEYGGLAEADSKKGKVTGFFHTEKIGGRWWLIDPHGHRFISVGLCSVNQTHFDDQQLQQKFGGIDKWAHVTGRMLKSAGFNTLGCWSKWEPFRRTEYRMPYTPRWNFMLHYKNKRAPKNGEKGYPNQCMPVFDPEFETFCDQHAKQLAKTKDDPWLLGHFSDNELPFRPDSLSNYLSLPKSDLGYKAAQIWWKDRSKGNTKKISSRDQAAFLQHVALRYYTVVNAAIKKHDPHHLYLGSRIHGRTICEPVLKGSKPVDVVTINYYHRWSPEQNRMSRWVKCSGRPFLISEWYAKALRSKSTKTGGAGFRVKTDRDRGLFYQNFAVGLLKHPGCVGWHWFKYAANEEGTHHGIVDRNYKPYANILSLMSELNMQVYPLVVKREWK
jgi:hypothetical protein